MIEQWGSGIPRVVSQVISHGLPEPEFLDMDTAFRVNIYRDQKRINDTKIDTIQNRKSPEVIPISSEDREKYLIDILKYKPHMTQKQLAYELHVSVPTVKRMISRLQEKGQVYREGTNRKGKWIVIS